MAQRREKLAIPFHDVFDMRAAEIDSAGPQAVISGVNRAMAIEAGKALSDQRIPVTPAWENTDRFLKDRNGNDCYMTGAANTASLVALVWPPHRLGLDGDGWEIPNCGKYVAG
eukprot:5367118-Heterocapsa_arctica.AAC.1